MGFGVGAHGAPWVLGAGLHDGAGGWAGSADVGCLPQLAYKAIRPVFKLLARQCRIPLGLLHVAQADRDIEHGVEAVETLFHVAVLGWPVVELQGIVCRHAGGDKNYHLMLKEEKSSQTVDRFKGEVGKGLRQPSAAINCPCHYVKNLTQRVICLDRFSLLGFKDLSSLKFSRFSNRKHTFKGQTI